MKEKSFEQAHRLLIEEASDIALKKANLKTSDIHFFSPW